MWGQFWTTYILTIWSPPQGHQLFAGAPVQDSKWLTNGQSKMPLPFLCEKIVQKWSNEEESCYHIYLS